MRFQGKIVVDLGPHIQDNALKRAVIAVVVPGIRKVVSEERTKALAAFRRAIPRDTGMMRRSARARMSVRCGRDRQYGAAARISVAFTFAGGEQVAFNTLAARHRPDLKDWPVRYMREQSWTRIVHRAADVARPVLLSGLQAIIRRELLKIARLLELQFGPSVTVRVR